MTDEKMSEMLIAIDKLCNSVNGLRLEVEGWRTHTGSTGYFLSSSVEKLVTTVTQLKNTADALKSSLQHD